jgi:glucose/arabinose dehydrogenase
MKARGVIAVVAACLLTAVWAGSAHAAVALQPVGTFNSPIYATSPPGDPRLFVVERGGTIQVLHDGTRTQFLDISALTTTDVERGLLSMAFDPNYATNGFFYVFYTGSTAAGGALGDIHIDRFHVSANPNLADPSSRTTLMTFPHSAGNHNGGQLQFGPDGMLYASVGDNANGANAQNLGNFYGKLLRIDPHGTLRQIWSYGLRNPFRFSFDHLTGDLVIGDVGESSWEEIDLARAPGLGQGANYGWPACEGFVNTGTGNPCSLPGATAPVFAYPHSDPGGGAAHGCAIIGGFVYRGTQVPELAGRYVYTDLCTGDLRSIALNQPLASGDRAEGPKLSSPNSFGQDSSCELYVTNGDVLDKIVSTAPPAVPPACPTAKTTAAQKCPKRHRKKKHHHAVAAKKHRKHKRHCGKHRRKHKKAAAPAV